MARALVQAPAGTAQETTMVDHTLGTDTLVLTLSTDDRWLHVGTVTEVLAHAARHRVPGHADAAPRSSPRAVDFYDASGHRLSPVLDESLEVRGFTTAGGRPAPVTVRRRVDRVLAHAGAHLAAHPPGDTTPYPPGTVVPQVDGDLPEVLRQLHAAEVPPVNAHKAGWFHNFMHALG